MKKHRSLFFYFINAKQYFILFLVVISWPTNVAFTEEEKKGTMLLSFTAVSALVSILYFVQNYYINNDIMKEVRLR